MTNPSTPEMEAILAANIRPWLVKLLDAHNIAAGKIDWREHEAATQEIVTSVKSVAALSTTEQARTEALERALRNVINIPAVRRVLGTNHTLDCACPLCKARALLPATKPASVKEGDNG